MFKNEKGQSLVEFALVLPVLVLLLVGIFEFGFIFNAYLQINHASREGARTGAVRALDDDIEAVVLQSTPTLDPSNMIITITPDESIRGRGDSITVEIDYEHHLLSLFLGDVMSSTLDLHAETIMRIE